MADLKDVIDAMVTRIQTGYVNQTIAGRTYGFGKDTIDPPCIIVVPAQGEFLNYDVTFEGKDELELAIKVLIGAQATEAGQRSLMDYFSRSGALSLRTVIYADPKLGNTVADLEILSASSWGDVEWAGVVYFGAQLGVKVYA